MSKGMITMSTKEISRLEVIQKVITRQLSVSEASQLLGITERQVKRLTRAYRAQGAAGLQSKKRGKLSNNRLSPALKETILQLVFSQYADFGPTLACEKLKEIDGLSVSKETLRKWMQERGLWKSGRRKRARVHQMRERRACVGELVQIDGSHHDWFEGRRDKCCLLVFVDDATGCLQQMRFEETETTFGYFAATRDYLKEHGCPFAFYSDKHGIFRINATESRSDATTQFERAMQTLDIKVICANSPQAKGRVERMNGTLQDRLVKELRLRGISTLEAANAFIPEFKADYNRRFAVIPKSDIDAHRAIIPTEEEMDLIFSLHENRKLSKNLEISYKNELFQIQCATPGYAMRHATVSVSESADGTIRILYKGRTLPYTRLKKNQRPAPIVDSKSVNKVIDKLLQHDGRSKGHKPAADHPWRTPKPTRSGASSNILVPATVTHNPTGTAV